MLQKESWNFILLLLLLPFNEIYLVKGFGTRSMAKRYKKIRLSLSLVGPSWGSHGLRRMWRQVYDTLFVNSRIGLFWTLYFGQNSIKWSLGLEELGLYVRHMNQDFYLRLCPNLESKLGFWLSICVPRCEKCELAT